MESKPGREGETPHSFNDGDLRTCRLPADAELSATNYAGARNFGSGGVQQYESLNFLVELREKTRKGII